MDWNSLMDTLIKNEFFYKLLAAAAEIAVGFMLGPFIRRMILRIQGKGVDKGVLTFLASFTNIAVRFLAIIIALSQIGVPVATMVGAVSAVGLGVTLALKESMANVAGGLQILITKPFRIGDYIAITGSSEGTVKEIEIMFTTLQTANMQQVVVPNSYIVSNTIINYSNYPSRRIVITVSANLNSDYASFREKAVEAMKANPKVLKDPAPTTVIPGFTADGNGVNINCVCYVPQELYWDVLFDLNDAIQQQRKAAGLVQPSELIEVENK